jgi:glycosyltransferase involved in cell wall biosynthesis
MNVLHINTYNSQGGAETIASSFLNNNPNNHLLVKYSSISNKQVSVFKVYLIDRFFLLLDKIIWKLGIRKTFKKTFFLEEEWNCTYTKLSKMEVYQKADIIHLHNIHGGYFDLCALKKIAKEKKIVWTLHDMWCMTGGEAHTFENNNYKIGIGKTPYKHIPPLINPVIDRRQHWIDYKKKLYAEISENIYFVPVSKWLEKCFTDSFVFNHNTKEKMIYNGFDDAVFFPMKEKKSDVLKILIFKSENPFKGASIFEEVLQNISVPFELFVVGDLINLPKIKTTRFDYIKDRHQLAALYNKVDILIFSSLADCFPLVPMEAMACGVCVFASNVGGIPELITHNETGYLFSTKEDLINQLNTQLQDLEAIRKIGELAATKIHDCFKRNKMLEQYNELYTLHLGI